jgi:hypothetical protein
MMLERMFATQEESQPLIQLLQTQQATGSLIGGKFETDHEDICLFFMQPA